MKNSGNVTQYEDFKYVLQDTGNIYLGARFSFGELLEQEMVPFKLKAILTHYILKEVSPETTLESQFYYLEKDTFLYETFRQLKIRIKVQRQVEKRSLAGKIKREYREEILPLKELAEIGLAQKKASGIMVQEIIVSKLGMMTFTI